MSTITDEKSAERLQQVPASKEVRDHEAKDKAEKRGMWATLLEDMGEYAKAENKKRQEKGQKAIEAPTPDTIVASTVLLNNLTEDTAAAYRMSKVNPAEARRMQDEAMANFYDAPAIVVATAWTRMYVQAEKEYLEHQREAAEHRAALDAMSRMDDQAPVAR